MKEIKQINNENENELKKENGKNINIFIIKNQIKII